LLNDGLLYAGQQRIVGWMMRRLWTSASGRGSHAQLKHTFDMEHHLFLRWD